MSGLSKLLLAGGQCDVRAGESVERAAHSNNDIHSQILCQNINFLTWTEKPTSKVDSTRRISHKILENTKISGRSRKRFGAEIGKSENDRLPKNIISNFFETSTRGEKILGDMADGWSRISELFFTG